MSTHLRRAVPGDEPILRDLRLEAMRESPEAFGSNYERELKRTPADWQRWMSPGATFILEDDGTPAGLVAAARDSSDQLVANLMAMWVAPALRGSGAAEQLVAAVCEWAEAEGARCVRLSVIKTNERAQRLYQRCGFRMTGEEAARADGRVEVTMEKQIAKWRNAR